MTKELSALFDGELEVHEEAGLWAVLKGDPHLRERWQNYKLIGDAIRDERNLASDITGGVMRELVDEPVVLAPRTRRAPTWSSAIMAMAASVAGIAVVGWLALMPQIQGGEPATLTQSRQVPAAVVVTQVATQPNSQGIQEYVLAHQANAPGLHLQGGTQHIRTVSVVGGSK
jgi:sigma-E factor negative regulatory protein RseA